MSDVELIRGGEAADDRGVLMFVNDLDLSSYRRFYVVRNHTAGFIRAWHGHRHESKAVVVVSGAAIVAAVKVDDWENPDPSARVQRFVLSADVPGALCIPAGYANGFMTFTADTRVCFFSSSTLEESAGDDIRFPARLWDPWSVEER